MHGLWGLIHIIVLTMANGTTVNAEQLVKLRKRTSASGNTILFLDYVQFGERVRESIGLTLLPGSTLAIKEKNRGHAGAVRVKELIESPPFSFDSASLYHTISEKWTCATKKRHRERDAPLHYHDDRLFCPQRPCRRDSQNLIACSIDGIYHNNK